MLMNLNHPGIVKFHGHLQRTAIVMELCIPDMSRLIDPSRNRRYPSEPEVAHLMKQVVEAIRHMHQQNILHR